MKAETCNILKLRGVDYSVCLQVSEGSLSVDVELSSTLEQWQGTYDRNYVEELTRKVDNFKQFSVFCNMLETALMRTKDSVTLDLRTATEIEDLRLSSTANVQLQSTAVCAPQPQNDVAQSNGPPTRFLILIYKTQFDRVHYSLPLTHIGRADLRKMQQKIRLLKNELRHARTKSLSSDTNAICLIGEGDQYESHTARFEVDQLRDEKAVLERDIDELRLRKLHSNLGFSAASSPRVAADGDGEPQCTPSKDEQRRRTSVEYTRVLVAKNEDLRREIGLLKGVAQNLEAERYSEKREFQKTLGQRKCEFHELKQKLEVLHASERSLSIKLKQAANELEACKRLRAGSSRSYTAPGVQPDRTLRNRSALEPRASAGCYQPRSRSVSAKQPKLAESAREARKRDRLERSLLKSLPKSAREFFGDGQTAAQYEVVNLHSSSNSKSLATRDVVVPATSVASPVLVAQKAAASSLSLPRSHRITPRSSLECMPLVEPRSSSREHERAVKTSSPILRQSQRNEASLLALQSTNRNDRLANTTFEPKSILHSNKKLEYSQSSQGEVEADRDLVEIDARLQRIQNMMKNYGLPARS